MLRELTEARSLAEAAFFGHPIPADSDPKLSLRVDAGVMDGVATVPGKWTVTASSYVSGW